MNPRRRWLRRKRFLIPCALAIALAGYLACDYHEPRVVPIEPDQVWGMPCLRADDLVVQGHDAEGHLWATRGMWAYRCRKGETRFVRQYHVPTGWSVYWLMNFSFVRAVAHRDECVELLALPGGAACAMSGGHLWHRPTEGAAFEKSLTLPHYGVGVGRGIVPGGLARLKDGTIIFGEYFRNDERTRVRLYASKDNGRTWEVAHEFPPGRIRHVHVVQQDTCTDKAWICTGDHDAESMISWTTDAGKTLHSIGQGSQMWRACQLVFTDQAVFWGADTGKASLAGIYRWDRKARQITKLAAVPGFVLFATKLADGTIVMSSDREGARIEKDDLTRLWVITDGKTVASIPCGAWGSRKTFAYLRFERTQGGSHLCLTCRNVDKYDGDLLVIAPEALRKTAGRTGTRPATADHAGTKPAPGP